MTDPTVEANARFHLHNRPLVSPGKCAVCGTAERPVVDFGSNVDWYGAILLCGECVTEAARLFGMVDRDEYDRLQEQSDQSFSVTLAQLNCKAVPNEWLQRAADLLGDIPILDVDSGLSDSAESFEQSGQKDSIESTGNVESAEHDTPTTRRKRSARVSADTSDGDLDAVLGL